MERKQSVTQNMQYKIARFQSGYEIVSFAAVIGRGVTQLSVLLGGGGALRDNQKTAAKETKYERVGF